MDKVTELYPDNMKQALIILDKKIRHLDAKFVANVHDEWQIECNVPKVKLLLGLYWRQI